MKSFAHLSFIALLLAGTTAAGAQTAPPVAAKSPDQMTTEEFAAWKKANGSWYVQCDGQPDNMGGGEQAARIVGAITLLGLFAPAPEAADPGKRKFGAEGVAACSRLIEGEKRESSAARRYGLILARGAHRIEAKDYAAALADADLARQTATEAGLMADPYWASSRGRGPDLLRAAALYRQGKVAEARDVALTLTDPGRYSLLTLVSVPRYFEATAERGALEATYAEAFNRSYPFGSFETADRLEQAGRFADAAALRDALIDLSRASTGATGQIASVHFARAAVTHALAGNRDRAAQLAKDAQANFDKRKADGKPDGEPGDFVEQMDLYAIIRTADAGDTKAARRLFAARSQWVAASLGSVLDVNRRLRTGAAPDELIGGLEKTPDALRRARADDELAKALAKDADNKTLFTMFPAAADARAYEAVSKATWNTQKSPWILKPKKVEPDASKFETMFSFGTSPAVLSQAYMLHAALLAKSRGQQGFVIVPIIAGGIYAARILTGNPGDPGLPAPFFNDASTVITALSPIIPSPADLKARQVGAARAAR